jgi:SAM-dependent methyltransferase
MRGPGEEEAARAAATAGTGVPPLRFRAALRLLRAAYRGAPPGLRAHALGRFFTCPFLPVLTHLPPGGRLLDLGAGHGTFALLAVAGGGAREAVAVEPDFRKLLPTFRHRGVRLVGAYADAVHGTFEAASVFDVLCRMPLPAWDGLLTAARDRLAPGGVLLVKEIDSTRPLKGRWNRLQERLADLLGMTLGDAFSYEPPAAMVARLQRLGFTDVRTRDLGRGYPHAHLLYVARRP